MSSERSYLQSFIAGESRAYGFTIAFWGSGTMLINAHGVPGIIWALMYGIGAVTGVAILALAVYGKSGEEVSDQDSSYVVLGMVHYLAALVPIILTYAITKLGLPPAADFFLSGLVVSTTYNILAVLEEDLVEIWENVNPS